MSKLEFDVNVLIGFLEGYDHEHLPDGAWFQALSDGAESFKKKFKTRLDAHDLVMIYLQANSVKTKELND